MVRQIVHYRKRAVNLLRQNHAHKLMGISRFPKRNFEIGAVFHFVAHAVAAADDESYLGNALCHFDTH